MKKLILVFVLLFAAVGLKGQTQPESVFNEVKTGNGFVRRCSMWIADPNDDSRFSQGDTEFCAGYIVGIVDGIVTIEGISGKHSFCIPKHPDKPNKMAIDNGQIVAILVKYIRDNPATAHLPTSVLLFAAFRDSFPCRSR